MYKKIPNIHFICDKRAGEIGAFGKIPVYEPSKLEYVNEAIYIIVCAYAVDQYEEICNEIKKYDINAISFSLVVTILLLEIHFGKRNRHIG